jgi:hypothetical protein
MYSTGLRRCKGRAGLHATAARVVGGGSLSVRVRDLRSWWLLQIYRGRPKRQGQAWSAPAFAPRTPQKGRMRHSGQPGQAPFDTIGGHWQFEAHTQPTVEPSAKPAILWPVEALPNGSRDQRCVVSEVPHVGRRVCVFKVLTSIDRGSLSPRVYTVPLVSGGRALARSCAQGGSWGAKATWTNR